MALTRRYLVQSAREVDPLSWFTGTHLPLAAATLMGIYGLVLIVREGGDDAVRFGIQLGALALAVGACLLTHFLSRPMRPPIGWGLATVVFGIAALAMVLSAVGHAGTTLALELWWAPGAITLAAASLSPYIAARKILVVGGGWSLVAVAASVILLLPAQQTWGLVGTAVLVAYAPVIGLVATSVFSYSIVSTILPMLESPSRLVVAGRDVHDEAADRIERVTLAQLTARAAPFLESIAEAGIVTHEQRALAGQLARRIRDDLVTQSNISWLESIAEKSRLVVVDPDRRAKHMDPAQRTALRALLQAILDTPGTDAGSLLVELRAAPDGATAVGVSLDITLPEGRRIMHLAPYYLTLGTAVDDLRVDRDLLGVTFRILPTAEDRG